MSFTDIKFKQRGRAEIDFLISVGFGGQTVRNQVSNKMDKTIAQLGELPSDLDQCNHVLENELSKFSVFRVQNLMGEWYSKQHGRVAITAFEEVHAELEESLDALSVGQSTIHIDDDFVAPEYWEGVEFHRTTGGWEGHPHMGYIHGEIIHRKMVDKFFPGGVFKQRKAVAMLAEQDRYGHILEMGCSSGHFTKALAETYPQANITGVDLSLCMLQHAQRLANEQNWSWQLYQRAAEDTRFDDNQFDLVTSYILLHEMPEQAIRAMFKEALRVMKPGAEMLMSDVSRYADLNPRERWLADRGAKYGGEPHWRSSASLDLKQVIEDAGFVDVSAGGMNGQLYPYIVKGRKPNE